LLIQINEIAIVGSRRSALIRAAELTAGCDFATTSGATLGPRGALQRREG
jgi:hypothetical protein